MADRAEEQLLGYLLGALEDSERQRLRKQLEESPALRRRLARVRRKLGPLRQARREHVPSPGLAARTCQLVAEHRRQQAVTERPALAATAQVSTMSPVQTPPVAASSWSWLDLAAAVGIAAATFLLLFPAIANSRFNAQLAECRENLRRTGSALAQYSQRHQDYFPQVPGGGRLAAGTYASLLLQDGFLTDPRRLVCPASPSAADPRFQVPSLTELMQARSPEELSRLRSALGGSYGYYLGYVENGRYQAAGNLQRPRFAIMADVPGDPSAGYQSLNHGGRGQNVLFVEEGRVAYFPSSSRPNDLMDGFFVHTAGRVAAGAQGDEAMIGAGSSIPAILVQTQSP